MKYNFRKLYSIDVSDIPGKQDIHVIEKAADFINQWHEDDYPQRVASTVHAIVFALGMWDTIQSVQPMHFQQLASIIKDGRYLAIEHYRRTPVTINNQVFGSHPEHIAAQVGQLCHNFCAYSFGSDRDLIEMYTRFEDIHPFIDYNGRVGGAALAALSFIHSNCEYMILPEQ